MQFRLMKPDFAALEPLRISVWDVEAESSYDIDLIFLAHDVLELRMSGRVLPRGFRLQGDMAFVEIQRETAEELEEQFEEDIEDDGRYYRARAPQSFSPDIGNMTSMHTAKRPHEDPVALAVKDFRI
jgi:hypothetical protein